MSACVERRLEPLSIQRTIDDVNRPRGPRALLLGHSHPPVFFTRRRAVWRAVDVVKLPRGHRPLSPVPTTTGHGHCPLVYPRGIRREMSLARSMGQYARTARVHRAQNLALRLFTIIKFEAREKAE